MLCISANSAPLREIGRRGRLWRRGVGVSQAFNPYEKLLGICIHGRAPDDWELLGIERDEKDSNRIRLGMVRRLV